MSGRLKYRGAELSMDHSLVASWVWWQRWIPNSPDKLKHIWLVFKKHLVESYHGIFNLLLCEGFSQVPWEVGDMKSELDMFRDSYKVADFRSCSLKVICTYHGSNQRTCWWTPAVMDVSSWRRRPSGLDYPRELLNQLTGTGTPDRQQLVDAKTRAWKDFRNYRTFCTFTWNLWASLTYLKSTRTLFWVRVHQSSALIKKLQ